LFLFRFLITSNDTLSDTYNAGAHGGHDSVPWMIAVPVMVHFLVEEKQSGTTSETRSLPW